MVVPLIVAGMAVSACARTATTDGSPTDPPAKVQPIEGTGLSRVILSRDAARRLDVRTAPVSGTAATGGNASRTGVPYAAVLYDQNGETWVYTNPEPLVFVRHPIHVEHIDGDLAVLLDGPPVGTAVVTVGASELLGTEYAVGGE